MKAIVIEERKFDQLFDDTLTQLELLALREQARHSDVFAQESIKELVRKFRFQIVALKDRLIQPESRR